MHSEDNRRAEKAEPAMPTKVWSDKDERLYEHVKQSEHEKEGRSMKRAKQIAAATVNKKRRKEGRTKRRRSTR